MASQNKYFSDLSKLEALDGLNFKRWSQCILIFLEQLEVDVLFKDPPARASITPVSSAD
ncbi:hypothetical protein LINGRAHAP2_LOCUS14063, partial [Linum grandiflorum]